MTTFDSIKTALSKLLEQIVEGKIQLPDFQRGWVWDDAHIRSLLVSIARSFPIGCVMLLEDGGAARFQTRLIEGVKLHPEAELKPESLILDGQQRLTSLTQVLKLMEAVRTRDEKKRELQLFYYFHIERALEDPANLELAIVAVDKKRELRANFGRDVVLDLGTMEKEFEAFHFPCNQILNSDKWEQGLMAHSPSKFLRYMEFRQLVLTPFREYQVPVIQLKKETSKEAVCLVFEKVNTGGVPLSVFELVTATYASDGFNLRDDWFGKSDNGAEGRHKKFRAKPLLRDLEPTEFLQGLSLLHTRDKRGDDLRSGKVGKELTPVSAKREHVLTLPLSAYRRWADELTKGFFEADRFLRMEGFHEPKFLPYRSQLIPLAAAMVHLGERWLEPVVRGKLARWYWCGVFGELYGSAIETRIANDLVDLLAWIEGPAQPEPTTVVAAGFQRSRLGTMRSRTSAAYRGIYVLLQREGAKDFFWKAEIKQLDQDESKIEIHHIFPRKWCDTNKILGRVYNSIINKTPISYKANRMIGGKAPSIYLSEIQAHRNVQLPEREMDDILKTHLIAPVHLRADDFDSFLRAREQALLEMVEAVMGKDALPAVEEPMDGASIDDEEVDEE